MMLDLRKARLTKSINRINNNLRTIVAELIDLDTSSPRDGVRHDIVGRSTTISNPTLSIVMAWESQTERYIDKVSSTLNRLAALSAALNEQSTGVKEWEQRMEGPNRPGIQTAPWRSLLHDAVVLAEILTTEVEDGWLKLRGESVSDVAGLEVLDEAMDSYLGDVLDAMGQLSDETTRLVRRISNTPVHTCICGCKRRVQTPRQTHPACRKRKSRHG